MKVTVDEDYEFDISEKYREVIMAFIGSLGVKKVDEDDSE